MQEDFVNDIDLCLKMLILEMKKAPLSSNQLPHDDVDGILRDQLESLN